MIPSLPKTTNELLSLGPAELPTGPSLVPSIDWEGRLPSAERETAEIQGFPDILAELNAPAVRADRQAETPLGVPTIDTSGDEVREALEGESPVREGQVSALGPDTSGDRLPVPGIGLPPSFELPARSLEPTENSARRPEPAQSRVPGDIELDVQPALRTARATEFGQEKLEAGPPAPAINLAQDSRAGPQVFPETDGRIGAVDSTASQPLLRPSMKGPVFTKMEAPAPAVEVLRQGGAVKPSRPILTEGSQPAEQGEPLPASPPLPDAPSPIQPSAPAPLAQGIAFVSPPVASIPLSSPQPTAAPAAPLPQDAADIAQAIDLAVEARETGRNLRPELSLRHGEFGLVNMRIEGMGGDLRATLNSRDPGFAPAFHAALADRAIAAPPEAGQTGSQRGNDGSGNAHHGGHSGPGTGGQGSAGSDPRYGSSPGSGHAANKPYSEQDASEGRSGGSRNSRSAATDHPGGRGTGLFA